jgi:hypothetical protein
VKAVVVNCTLEPGSETSNTQLLADVVIGELAGHGVETELFRLADLSVPPGVVTDAGGGDEWPPVGEHGPDHGHELGRGRPGPRRAPDSATTRN